MWSWAGVLGGLHACMEGQCIWVCEPSS